MNYLKLQSRAQSQCYSACKFTKKIRYSKKVADFFSVYLHFYLLMPCISKYLSLDRTAITRM